ncbi:MAG TPA: argininosuccinate lyase [Vicinamibacterales bacterium]|nr:argininosuccinate lyase [Vicinamibacterales bacterium]
MAHLWSGRFAGDPDRALFEFGASFRFDRRLFEDDVRGSLAWAEALERAGVLTAADAAAIRAALEEMLQRGADADFFASAAAARDEDVHSFVERELVARVGDAGRRLHTGRSRNEQVAVDLRLYLKRRIPLLQQAIRALVEALLDRAGAAGDALMPSYTHLRRAQPILVAHFFLAHVAPLQRDHARLVAVAAEADELPLGSGAIAGTSYPIDVELLRMRLGFSRVVTNSVDATGERDFVSSFLHATALAMVHLSRVCEDLILFTSEEFGFLDLADAAATGSSLMPQKKNPDPLELVRGKTGRVIGRLTGWLTTMKGLPIGYSKDLQEDKEALFEAEDTLRASLDAVTAVVRGLVVRPAVSGRAASGLLLATDVADYLVARGVPFRDAHEIVGALVRRLLDEGRSFDALSGDEWRAHSPLFEADIVEWVTPEASIARKRTPQSTHPDRVAEALANARAWLSNP